MQIDNQSWLSVVNELQSAAVGESCWLSALSKLASATGSRAGELIGLGSANSIPFNWVSGLGQEWVEDFAASGGGDPRINPFVRAGSQCPAFKVLASAEFITPEERRTNPFLAGHARRFDIQHICLTPLIKNNDTLIGLAVIRSGRQGEINPLERQFFTSIAPHVYTAVRTQISLEHQGAQLMAGALEALSMAVFICSPSGTVKAMTPAAEALLSAGDTLFMRRGQLRVSCLRETRDLTNAIHVAAAGFRNPGVPRAKSILIHGTLSQPLVLEVLPVPQRENAFSFEPRVLVVVRHCAQDPNRMRILLRAAYGLTSAEVEVALGLAEGLSPETIASQRCAAIATVRKQITSIFDKLDVHRQNELIARINQLR